MPLKQVWLCDYCGLQTETPDPQGWLLKGRHNGPMSYTEHQLWFCQDTCATQFFQQYSNPV